MRSNQTFVHLHHALQLAFDWDDDHLYTFWLGTKFWPRAGTEFCNPYSFENPGPLAAFFAGERGPGSDPRRRGSTGPDCCRARSSPTCSTSATSGAFC
ncbi:MAG: hypothetical protein ACLP8S_11405 [Solirubrobacteraceae bacterium]